MVGTEGELAVQVMGDEGEASWGGQAIHRD